MSLETAIRAHLAGKDEITEMVDTRILFGEIDVSREPMPQIVFTIADHDFTSTLSDVVDLQMPVVAVEVRSYAVGDLDRISRRVLRALTELSLGATVNVPGESSEDIECLTILDGGTDEPPITIRNDDDTVTVFRRVILAQVGYRYDLTPII
jgi:hypothetical protein